MPITGVHWTANLKFCCLGQLLFHYGMRVRVWTLSTGQESEHEKLFSPERVKYVSWLSLWKAIF